MALFPFKKPTASDTEYFGGIERIRWMWSICTFPSKISIFLHSHSCRMISLIDFPTLPLSCYQRSRSLPKSPFRKFTNAIRRNTCLSRFFKEKHQNSFEGSCNGCPYLWLLSYFKASFNRTAFGTGLICWAFRYWGFSDLRQSRRIVCEPLKAVIKPCAT